MKKNGVDLQEVPLFLMLGSPDRELSDVLVRSTGREFLVPGRPEGRAPLCWYASREAVFLFTAETGCLSRLSSVPERMPSAVDRPSAAAGTPSITGTLITGAVEQTGRGAGVRGSLPPLSGAAAIRGTLVPSAGAGEQPAAAAQHSGARRLSLREFDEESDRLRYVGQLLRRERQPLCPLNGQMVLVPSPLLTDVLAAQETIEAIRRDLETVREATQVNCPATLLVTGMEHVPGFVELVRRVGIQLAKETRFGKGYNVWSPVDPENMDALSSQACGAFEDWVYTLFREAGGLGKPGNSKLYRLLCLIRGQFQQRIRSLLVHAIARDSEPAESGCWMFGGCYFAATGSAEDRQAFTRSVLDKMLQQDEDVEWTEAALAEDQGYRRVAQGLTFVNGILAVSLTGLIIWMFIH